MFRHRLSDASARKHSVTGGRIPYDPARSYAEAVYQQYAAMRISGVACGYWLERGSDAAVVLRLEARYLQENTPK